MMRWRRARPEDMTVLIDWIDSPETLVRWGGPSLTWPSSPDQLWQQIDAISFPSFSLEEDGALLAFGQLALREQGIPQHLCRLVVAPHRRGQQLGERLCRHLMAHAARMGATQVTLNVAMTNEHAVRLYRRLGFINAGPVSERGIQAMTLSLSS